MKSFFTAVLLMYCTTIFAIDHACAQASPSPAPAVQASPTPVVLATPIPAVTAPTGPVQVTVQDAAAVPPEWVQTVVAGAEKLPIVGPWVVLIVKWLSIIVTALTLLCGFIIGILSLVKQGTNSTSTDSFAAKIQTFEDSKFMYYLKFFSAFNAQKPAAVAATQPPADPSAPTAA